jgi:hypothetical protein
MAYNTVLDGISEWSRWWHEHRDTDRSIENEIAFIKKAMDGFLDMIAVAAVEVEAVKRIGAEVAEKQLEKGLSNALIKLPTGIRVPR